MKRIAILGAPFAGKSSVAALAVKAVDGTSEIVDNYIPAIEQRSDVVLGMYASWLGNLQVAIGRYEFERKAALNKPDYLITVGTVVETVVYQALYSALGMNSQDEAVKLYTYARANPTVEVLGGIVGDSWRYDYVFYLPLSEELKNHEDHVYDARVDEQIIPCLEAFKLSFTQLEDSSMEAENVAKMVKEIESEAPDKSGVRERGEASEGIGDSP